jgi:adenylyl-sulfate kinase
LLPSKAQDRGGFPVLVDKNQCVPVVRFQGTGRPELGELSTAGFAGAALLMVDMNAGVAPAVRRQLFLLAQMGVRHVALAAAGERRVEQQLYRLGHHTYLLDGDNVRHGLNRDLGFTEADRVENIRRVGEVAKLMADAGLIVLTAFISPFRTERQMARDLLTDGEFLEVFVDVPLEVAEERDPKGLYKKARRGQLKNFTGIDSPYEVPERPELVVDTSAMTAEEAADRVIDALRARGRLPAI